MGQPPRGDNLSEQAKRRRVRLRDSTTGFRGVYFRKNEGKWHARIKVGDRRISLGFFPSPEEASRAYEAAAQEHFGEYYRRLQ